VFASRLARDDEAGTRSRRVPGLLPRGRSLVPGLALDQHRVAKTTIASARLRIP
jgi:hypothetical protein